MKVNLLFKQARKAGLSLMLTFQFFRLNLAISCLLGAFFHSPLWAADSVYRHIAELSISAQEKSSVSENSDLCKGFQLTRAQALRILKTSLEIDPRTYAHELETAPCSVEGTLKTKNGLLANWQIDMSGRAKVLFDNDHVLLLHCKSCTKSPFAK